MENRVPKKFVDPKIMGSANFNIHMNRAESKLLDWKILRMTCFHMISGFKRRVFVEKYKKSELETKGSEISN